MPGARAADPTPARAAARFPPWAAGCFLASGAAGLVYEVVWSKQLTYLLGSSLHSVAIVAAAFLGGLALGARALGAPLARGGEPARRYALLELAVAAAGLLVLPLLRSLEGPVGMLYRLAGGEGARFAVARAALLFAVLVPPAALMGATLPVLVARCERGVVGAGLAALYAINTLGAVLGSLVAGYLLLPGLGLAASTGVAAGLNALAGLVALAFSARESRASPAPAPAAGPAHAPLLGDRARQALALAFAMSGFAALSLQLAWVRLYGLVLGSSVYSFAAVLGVFLAGLALGSAAVAPLVARLASPAAFALLELGIAASATAGMHAYGSLPRGMLELGERMGPSWTGLMVAQLGLVVPVLAAPTILMGALFPLATRLLQRGEVGEATGSAYALNTLGTIAGSLVTGFALLPALGVQGVVQASAALSAVAAGVALLLPGATRPRPPAIAAAATLGLLALAAALTTPRWDPVLMSLGTYRPFHAENLLTSFRNAGGGSGDPTREVAAAQRVLFSREGINASVLVATDLEGRRRWLRVGGKIDASTGDMLTQVMLGVLPAVMADPGARALVVGHGSGFTAAAVLAAGAGRTDIVELEPAVIQGSRLFHERGHDPLDDPRVTLYPEDARTRLAYGAGRYGLIVSEPSNPWIAGVNNLFTVDFYRRVRARLEPDGVFCQWIQLYELSPATFHSLLASFLDVFPDAHLFCLWRAYDVLLVAAPPERRLSLERLRSSALAEQIANARLGSPGEIASFYVASGPALRALVGGAARNTDDRPVVEYRAPRDLVEVGRGLSSHHPEVLGELSRALVPPPGSPLAGWPRELVLESRARARLEGASGPDAERVLGELRAAGEPALAERLAGEWRQREREARVAGWTERVRALAAAGDATGARQALEALVASGGDTPGNLLALARARREAGDVAGSGEAAERALPRLAGGPRVEALLLAGMAAHAGGRAARALACFREAQALAPTDPRGYDYEARVRFAARDLAGARAAVERGLARIPGEPTLTQALEALARQAAARR